MQRTRQRSMGIVVGENSPIFFINNEELPTTETHPEVQKFLTDKPSTQARHGVQNDSINQHLKRGDKQLNQKHGRLVRERVEVPCVFAQALAR